MSPFFSLLLGHLIGDFALQTIDLVRYKSQSWKGLFLHSAIVTASCAVCLWNNLPTWWPWLLPIFVLHWLTDWAKVDLGRRVSGWNTRFFFLDQFLHMVLVFIIVILQAGRWPYNSPAEAIGGGPANRNLVFLLAFIVALFVGPLLEAQAAHALTRYAPNRAGNGNGVAATMTDRLWGGAERTLVLLLLYIGAPAFWFAPLAFVPRILALWSVWKQPNQAPVYRVKIATSIILTLALGLLLRWVEPRL